MTVMICSICGGTFLSLLEHVQTEKHKKAAVKYFAKLNAKLVPSPKKVKTGS